MSTPVRDYRRVSPDETSNTATANGAVATGSLAAGPSDRLDAESHPPSSANSHPPRSVSERLADKMMAAVWVAVAVVISFWTDTLTVLLHPQTSDANVGLLQVAAVGIGINTVLVFYLTVYLPYGKGLTDSSAWPVYCPRVIPTMTITGVVVTVALIRATWPVWGILSPLILGVQALGLLFSLHFVPVWPQ